MIRTAVVAVVFALPCLSAHAQSAAERYAPAASPGVSATPSADSRLSITQLQAISPTSMKVLLEKQRELWEKPPPGVPLLNAVNRWTNPDFVGLDAPWRAGRIESPVFATPFFVSDTIDNEGLPTTMGALALRNNSAVRSARVVSRMLESRALLLGRTNVSEWGGYRGDHAASGWSALNGVVRNPYALDRSSCGSGAAAAVAAGMAPVGLDTGGDGALTCSAALVGIVGLKPTIGLVSRRGVRVLTLSQDTVGPLTLNVEDAARVLGVISGTDADDPATAEADRHKTDYFASLDPNALKGVKLAFLPLDDTYSIATKAAFDQAVGVLRAAGADIVEAPKIDQKAMTAAAAIVVRAETKAGVEAMLAATEPKGVATRNLAELIAFNETNAKVELRWFGQEQFERAQKAPALTDPAYLKAKADAKRLAGTEGVDRLLTATGAVALIAPTSGPAWTIDLANGDHATGSASALPTVAGYPQLTVPMGRVEGLPVGLSFIGPAWSEQLLLSLGYAFQEARKTF